LNYLKIPSAKLPSANRAILCQCITYKLKRIDSLSIQLMTSQTIDRRIKLDAVGLVAQGNSRQAVVDSTGLSHSTIYRAIRNQRIHGELAI
jgi:DNA invertase Pin-like site-specific DNA recombinase